MKEIPLTHGKAALVDDADYEMLSQYKWHARDRRGTWYAFRAGKTGPIAMHREIAKPAADKVVDHRNGDGLDNTRGNLRVCTRLQNARNRKKNKTSTAPYKGIAKVGERWRAFLFRAPGGSHLGMFDTPEEAARAYDKAALREYGEFARINGV